MGKPLRVFVASSSAKLEAAETVAQSLHEVWCADPGVERALAERPELDVRTWKEGTFRFSRTYIESLETELDKADFAIVVLTADDTSVVEGETVDLPRDNVIFELGLFMGRLGRTRSWFVVAGESDTKLATDLSGVEPIRYYEDSKSGPGLRQQMTTLAGSIAELGERFKLPKHVRREQAKMWLFARRVAGHWWERKHDNDGEGSLISFVEVSPDEPTNGIRVSGDSFDLEGERHARWETVATRITLEPRPEVTYWWTGMTEDEHGQQRGGGGVLEFEMGEDPTRGSGHFYDTRYAKMSEGVPTLRKRFQLYRCTPNDIATMQEGGEATRRLVQERTASLSGS